MAEYNLLGTKDCPQVEPEASYWLECPILQTVRLADVLNALGPLRPYPAEGSAQEADEITQLANLNQSSELAFAPQYLSGLLTDQRFFVKPPAGAIIPKPNGVPGPPVNGVELASLFEAEAPGLWHRHVLDVFTDPDPRLGFCQALSPPRLALIQAALEIAIASALAAAWWIKWLAPSGVGRRRRPAEADSALKVLFDYQIEWDPVTGRIHRTKPKVAVPGHQLPPTTPGTPRHPAYVSGHSTYSAAASGVLACFFPDQAGEFSKLADNIGMARLYGGVHWLSDHVFGQAIGGTVAQLVIAQLNTSGVKVDFAPLPADGDRPPSRAALDARAVAFGQNCGNGEENFCTGVLPSLAPRPSMHTLQIARH